MKTLQQTILLLGFSACGLTATSRAQHRDPEYGPESHGLRAAITSISHDQNANLIIVCKIVRVGNGGVFRRVNETIYIVFWDAKGERVGPSLSTEVLLHPDFTAVRTDSTTFSVEVGKPRIPKHAKLISVELDTFPVVTPKVRIPIRKSKD